MVTLQKVTNKNTSKNELKWGFLDTSRANLIQKYYDNVLEMSKVPVEQHKLR